MALPRSFRDSCAPRQSKTDDCGVRDRELSGSAYLLICRPIRECFPMRLSVHTRRVKVFELGSFTLNNRKITKRRNP